MSYLIFPGTLNGQPVSLHLGGTHDGWFLDANDNRLREATVAEIESAKTFFWKDVDTSATSASGVDSLKSTASG